jgi:5-formyltetrahydrofolate cyclo-ligase
MNRGMANTLQDRKAALRQEIRQVLAEMSLQKQASGSVQACALLREKPVWAQARAILFYAPLPGELDVWPLLEEAVKAGKVAALPRYVAATQTYTACQVRDLARHLEPGQFGIREPLQTCPEIELNQLDLTLVPGVAFDFHGRRLGRGKGFYDQLLPAVRGQTCGTAFDEQIVSEVPVEPRDVRLSCILTPTRWIEL